MKLAPPKIIDRIRSVEFAALIKDQLKPAHLRIVDHVYDIYSMADFRRFLNAVRRDIQEDALQLLGRERIWYNGPSSTFGYIVGDIRPPEEPCTERDCSANFFMDRNRQIWIVESWTGRVYRPTPSTTIEIVLI